MKSAYLIAYSVILLSILTSLPITQYVNAQLLPITVSQPPTNLTASLVAPSKINLSWTAPTAPTSLLLTGYKIERSTDGGNTWSTLVENTDNTSTTYTDSGLASGTTYTYQVSAINRVGTSSPSNTSSATTSDMTMTASFQTCCYGFLQMHGLISNPVSGDNNQVHVQFFAPNGQIVFDNTHITCSSCGGFGDGIGISRDQGKGNYTIIATYDNDLVAKTQVPSWINDDPVIFIANAIEYSDDSVLVNGQVVHGLAGEQVSIDIFDPNNSRTATFTMTTNTHAIYTLLIDATSASQIFPASGNYTIVVTHIPTGVTGSKILTYTR